MLKLGSDIKLTEADCKKKGIRVDKPEPHPQLEDPFYVNFTDQEDTDPSNSSNSKPKVEDPIELIVEIRQQLKLGEEKISQAEAREKQIPDFKLKPHEIIPPRQFLVDFTECLPEQ